MRLLESVHKGACSEPCLGNCMMNELIEHISCRFEQCGLHFAGTTAVILCATKGGWDMSRMEYR